MSLIGSITPFNKGASLINKKGVLILPDNDFCGLFLFSMQSILTWHLDLSHFLSDVRGLLCIF